MCKVFTLNYFQFFSQSLLLCSAGSQCRSPTGCPLSSILLMMFIDRISRHRQWAEDGSFSGSCFNFMQMMRFCWLLRTMSSILNWGIWMCRGRNEYQHLQPDQMSCSFKQSLLFVSEQKVETGMCFNADLIVCCEDRPGRQLWVVTKHVKVIF